MKPSSQLSSEFTRPKQQRGLSLVELLVALALGLFLMGGVISIFVSNQENFKSNEGLARIQENARFSFEQLSREVREAGTTPCGVRTVLSVIRTPTPAITPWWADWNSGTFIAYDRSNVSTLVPFGTAAGNRRSGTDALSILRASMLDNYLRPVEAHDTGINQLTLSSNANFDAKGGDVAVVCDSFSAAIFEVSLTSGAKNIQWSTPPPSSNCSTALGWRKDFDCATKVTNKQFQNDALVTKLDSAFWYVGVSPGGTGFSLYRVSLSKDGPSGGSKNATTVRQEIVPNVTGMRVEYLVRTRVPGVPPAPDTFTPPTQWENESGSAANYFIPANFGWSVNNLRQVIAVRLTLDFTDSTLGTNGQPLTRQTIAVISLRNREAP
jgi:type IV pilus assembly protein PilW